MHSRNHGKGQGRKQEALPGLLLAGSLPGGHKALLAFPFCLQLLLKPSSPALQDLPSPTQAPLYALQNSEFQEETWVCSRKKPSNPTKPTHCSLYHCRLFFSFAPIPNSSHLNPSFPVTRDKTGLRDQLDRSSAASRGQTAILQPSPRLLGSHAAIPITAAGGRKGFPCSISFLPTPSEDRSPVAPSKGEMGAAEEIQG